MAESLQQAVPFAWRRKMSTGKHPSFWIFFFHLRVFAVCFVAAIFLPVLWWDQLKNFRLKKELLENLTWNDVLPGIPDHEPGSSSWVPWVTNAHIQFGQALTWTIVLDTDFAETKVSNHTLHCSLQFPLHNTLLAKQLYLWSLTLWNWTYDFWSSRLRHPLYQCAIGGYVI